MLASGRVPAVELRFRFADPARLDALNLTRYRLGDWKRVMSRSIRRSPSGVVCPLWCQAIHAIDPHAVDHTRLAGAVLREPHLESVAVEIEQGVGGRVPRIVLSVFTQDDPVSLNADLTVDEARRAHAALGRALQFAAGGSSASGR